MTSLVVVVNWQERRTDELAAAVAAKERKATLIEYNLADVEAAMAAVNEALAAGVDWSELKVSIPPPSIASPVRSFYISALTASMPLSSLPSNVLSPSLRVAWTLRRGRVWTAVADSHREEKRQPRGVTHPRGAREKREFPNGSTRTQMHQCTVAETLARERVWGSCIWSATPSRCC